MICGEPQDPARTIRFSLRLEKLRKARNAGELKRWSTQRDRHAQRRRELGARSGPVAAPQCEMRELKLQPARESAIAGAIRDLERTSGIGLGRDVVARLQGDLGQVRQNQPARADKAMTITEGEPVSQ